MMTFQTTLLRFLAPDISANVFLRPDRSPFSALRRACVSPHLRMVPSGAEIAGAVPRSAALAALRRAWTCARFSSESGVHGSPSDVRFDAEGALAAETTKCGRLRLLDVERSLSSGAPCVSLDLSLGAGTAGSATSVAWRPQLQLSKASQTDVLVGALRTSAAMLFDLERCDDAGTPTAVLTPREESAPFAMVGPALSVAFLSHDVAIGGYHDGAIRLWDLRASGRFPVAQAFLRCGPLWTVAPLPGSDRQLVGSGAKGFVSIWDLRKSSASNGKCVFGTDPRPRRVNVVDSALRICTGDARQSSHLGGMLLAFEMCPFLPGVAAFLVLAEEEKLILGTFDLAQNSLLASVVLDHVEPAPSPSEDPLGDNAPPSLADGAMLTSRMRVAFLRDQFSQSALTASIVCGTKSGLSFWPKFPLSRGDSSSPGEVFPDEAVFLDCGSACKTLDVHPFLPHTLFCNGHFSGLSLLTPIPETDR